MNSQPPKNKSAKQPKQTAGRARLKRILTITMMSFTSIWVLIVLSITVSDAIAWFVGILLGFNAFSSDLTNTALAQIFVGTLFANTILLFVLWQQWIRKLTKDLFWRVFSKVMIVGTVISLILAIIVPTVLFLDGQNGGDYGCSQEVTLEQAMNATYPINADNGGGTGFAINDSGDIVTAYHVIDGAKDISLGDEKNSKLTIVRVNKEFDVALLHANIKTPDYLPLTDDYYIADPVYEIGWPDNVDSAGVATITHGIISRLITSEDANNSGDKVPKELSYIQTDAATNSGNSGGPLVDTCGAVGVMNSSAVIDPSSNEPQIVGINYATSSESVRFALKLDN